MKVKLIATIGLIAAIWGISCNKPDNPSRYLMSKIDYEFLTKATNQLNNQVYIQSYIIDSSRGRYPDGTIYNNYLMNYTYPAYRDHKAERVKLLQLAAMYLFTPPDTLPDANHVVLLNQLKTISGRAFDSVYINSQINDNAKLVDLYTYEANFGVNDSIKNVAAIHLSAELIHQQSAGYYKPLLLP
jgi:hypothetical protein